jgi:ferredoxin
VGETAGSAAGTEEGTVTHPTGTWQVEVDRDRCLGTGACVYTAPGVFALGDDAVVRVVGAVDGADDRVRDAVAECPVEALRLVQAEGPA